MPCTKISTLQAAQPDTQPSNMNSAVQETGACLSTRNSLALLFNAYFKAQIQNNATFWLQSLSANTSQMMITLVKKQNLVAVCEFKLVVSMQRMPIYNRPMAK